MKGRIFFPKRIPEPKPMMKKELEAFESLSLVNYKRWFIPFVDHSLQVSGLKRGFILDVACGSGFLVKEYALRSQKFHVVGVDFSENAIRIAKKNCAGLLNTELLLAKAEKLPFGNTSFDLVVCKDSLHQFDNVNNVLQEMLRVLKQGSLLYLQDLRRDLPFYLLKQALRPDTVLKKLQFYSARASYTKNEVKDILRKLGLKKYRVYTRKTTTRIRRYYERKGINAQDLKAAFQSRYIALAWKVQKL